LQIGDFVQTTFSDDGQRYPATIDNINADGTFTVRWDDPDGGPETSIVEADAMQKIIVFRNYKVGDDVRAVFPDGGSWYPGTVGRVNSDGTFQVKWDDADGGPESTDINPRHMRKVNVFKGYGVTDAVEALFADDGQMYPATVVQCNRDGTFKVKWKDPDGGPEESLVTSKNMQYPRIPFAKLRRGQKFTGFVEGIRDFGAFIDFGAERSGLLHVSMISKALKRRVQNIHDVFEDGQEVEVWILTNDGGKVCLSMMEVGPDVGELSTAFASVSSKDWFDGVVSQVVSFGAWVTVTLPSGDSATGLVHISELSDAIVDDVANVVAVGQRVKVRITNVDLKKNRMTLSMKDDRLTTLTTLASMSSDGWLTGTVKLMEPFGACVTVTLPTGERADGLVHVTEIAYHFVDSVNDVVKVGQSVQVRVKNVDLKRQKLSLSMKMSLAQRRSHLSVFKSIPPDQWLTGIVSRVSSDGVLIAVTAPDGKTTDEGWVHRTNVIKGLGGTIEDVKFYCHPGQKVTVLILAVDLVSCVMCLSMIEPDY